MHLSKLILLNWGQIESREYELGPMIQLSGVTGSGKSTTGDAIQTLMTAAKDGLYFYNPGQEEATQRGRTKMPRTLASYIVGADLNEFARPEGAHGYIGGVFVPSPGEDLPAFTALIGASAHVDVERSTENTRRNAMLEDSQFIIVEKAELSLQDLLGSSSADNMKVIPVTEIYTKLRKQYPTVLSFANKGHYLESLYSNLRGVRVSIREAEQAAKTFTRFMAYKPLDSINDFVRTQVLEEHDLQGKVANVANLMRDVSDLRAEAERYRTNIQALERCQRVGHNYLRACTDEALTRLQLALFRQRRAIQELGLQRDRRARLIDEQKFVLNEITRIDREDTLLEQRLETVSNARSQHNVALIQDSLEKEVGAARATLTSEMGALNGAINQLGENLNRLRTIRGIPAEGFAKAGYPEAAGMLDRLDAMDDGINMDELGQVVMALLVNNTLDRERTDRLLELVAGIDGRMERVIATLTDTDASLQVLASNAAATLRTQKNDKAQLLKDRQEEKAALESGLVNYPPEVKGALALLELKLPEAFPRVLCDLIRPRNEEWQPAIENFFGRSRFGILVKPEFEAPARKLLSEFKETSTASIIQGKLSMQDAERMVLPHESIVHDLLTDDSVARAFLVAKFGPVEKVYSVEALTKTRRGLTIDGQVAGGYLMTGPRGKVSEGLLVFGHAARVASAKTIAAEIEALQNEITTISSDLTGFELVQRLILDIRQPAIEAHARLVSEATRKGLEVQQQLQLLDTSEIADLDTELKTVKGSRADLKTERDKHIGRRDSIAEGLVSTEAAIEHGSKVVEDEDDAVRQQRGNLLPVVRHIPEFKPEEAEAELAEKLDDPDLTEAGISDRLESCRGRKGNHKQTFREEVSSYNMGDVRAGERISLDTQKIEELDALAAVTEALGHINHQHRVQVGTGLADKAEQLKKAEGSFNTAFTSDFCNLLNDSLRKGKLTLDGLNSELKEFRFGEETYRFNASWVPGMKQYADFFREVINIDGLGESQDLFSTEDLSEGMAQVRDELMGLLLSTDSEAAKKKLIEISDYRNYHHYEIYKEVPDRAPVALSTYGTASGGQFETPAYVIRLAAISSAFRLREKSPGHLRMVVTDEAFGKMDEARARAVLDYMSRKMGFQVIFIVPNTRAGTFLDMATHQMVFSKIDTEAGPGELRHLILVHWQKLNNIALAELWQRQRDFSERTAVQLFNEQYDKERALTVNT